MRRQSWKYLASVGISGLIVVLLLALPGRALSLTLSLAAAQASYFLGANVSLPASINLSSGEFQKVQSAQLQVTGADPSVPVEENTVNLPLAPGSQTLGQFDVSTSYQNVSYTSDYSYGYEGYGYAGPGRGGGPDYDQCRSDQHFAHSGHLRGYLVDK